MKRYFYSYFFEDFDITFTFFQEDDSIVRISFSPYEEETRQDLYEKYETDVIRTCITQISEYLSNKRTKFTFKYKLPKYTKFAKKVIDVVKDIPFGSQMSYSEVAKAAGHERASRAVGTVIAKNELPIVIPCHRVIRADCKIGEYAGGSDLKRRLLNLEGWTDKS